MKKIHAICKRNFKVYVVTLSICFYLFQRHLPFTKTCGGICTQEGGIVVTFTKQNYLIIILIVYNKPKKNTIKGYRNNTNTSRYKQKDINKGKYIAKFVEVKRQTIMLIKGGQPI